MDSPTTAIDSPTTAIDSPTRAIDSPTSSRPTQAKHLCFASRPCQDPGHTPTSQAASGIGIRGTTLAPHQLAGAEGELALAGAQRNAEVQSLHFASEQCN
eukprot:1138920-Pelagomonas_calceolata.AAC.3